MKSFSYIFLALATLSLSSTVYAEKVVVIPLTSKVTSFVELTDQVADEQISDVITRDTELFSYVTNVVTNHSSESAAHHEKYTDNDAVAAVQGADGPGSGLDADLLDGQHVSEIRYPSLMCAFDVAVLRSDFSPLVLRTEREFL